MVPRGQSVRQDIIYKKVYGENNHPTILTKYITAELSTRHLQAINSNMCDGRAETAPELVTIDETNKTEHRVEHEDPKVMSWVRTYGDKGEHKVKFNESFAVRPIAAHGNLISCTWTNGAKSKVGWSSLRGSSEKKSDESIFENNGGVSNLHENKFDQHGN